jgi:hypothetical protein
MFLTDKSLVLRKVIRRDSLAPVRTITEAEASDTYTDALYHWARHANYLLKVDEENKRSRK